MKKILLLIGLLSGFIIITNCSTAESLALSTKSLNLTLSECESYAVIKDKDTLGFIVKPFIIDIDTMTKYKIQEFEIQLKKKYRHRFHKKWRIYSFDKRNKDTVLITLIISYKRLEKNPEWKCKLDGVQNYPKHSIWIFYNLSKHSFLPEIKIPFYRRIFEVYF